MNCCIVQYSSIDIIPGIDTLHTHTHIIRNTFQGIICHLCDIVFYMHIHNIFPYYEVTVDYAHNSYHCCTNNAFLSSLVDVHSLTSSLSPTVTTLAHDQKVRSRMYL